MGKAPIWPSAPWQAVEVQWHTIEFGGIIWNIKPDSIVDFTFFPKTVVPGMPASQKKKKEKNSSHYNWETPKAR